MARILLAWELGGNAGHAVRLARLVAALHAEGHTTSLAVQRLDAFRRWRQAAGFAELRQAPVWPGLLRQAGLPTLTGEATWGDLLAGMGMTDSGVLEYLLRAWDQLLADARPDLVIGDFAPALMLAARGRLPVVAVGTGFTVPPGDVAAFPLLRPGATAPLIAEDILLQVVNRALWRLDRAPLDRLTALAGADLACPASFAELDPYRDHRRSPNLPPFLSGPPGQAGAGDAIFAYFAVADARTQRLAQALALVAAKGQRVSVWLPGLSGGDAAALTQAGVKVLGAGLPPAEIAAQARLLVGTGGLGTVSAALAAGLPMALLPVDLEKRLTAERVAALGAGVVLPTGPQTPVDDLAGRLLSAATDPDLRARAQTLAIGLRDRLDDPARRVARLIAGLA